MRRDVVLGGWAVVLVVIVALMVLAGHGSLAGPPLAEPARWAAWASSRGAPTAALAVVRLVVLATATYLLVVTGLVVAGDLLRQGRLVQLGDLLALPPVRHAMHAALGASLVGAAVAGAAGLRPLPAPAVSAATADRLLLVPPEIEPLGATSTTSTSSTTTTTTTPTTVPASAPSAPTPATEPARPSAWTVRAGDHLWSIATRSLTDGLGRTPSTAEVVSHWQLLVELNRDRLRDPSNPDLIYPGDDVLLPDLRSPAA